MITIRAIASVLALLAFSSNTSVNLPPGIGTRVAEFGDTFEEPGWEYNFNSPKLHNQFHNPGSGWVENIQAANNPRGSSANGRWQEGPTRGHPDVVEQVRTPSGGLPGSRYALRLQTKDSGTPNLTEGTLQQDDLLNMVPGKRIRNLPLGEGMSVVTRIYVPPIAQWENREGYHIGFRVGATGRNTEGKSINYWPGIWMVLEKDSNGNPQYRFAVRANNEGQDALATDKLYTRGGWWTLGMAFQRDGSIAYYASPGVDDLTPRDLLTYRAGSQSAAAIYKPYELEFQDLDYLFFSLGNTDGEWSTEFIVDDVAVYSVSSEE
jgi:hypothetical protein